MSQRIVKLGSLAPGINNRLEPTDLDTVMPDRSKGRYLYGASNVDINEKGNISRRRGMTTALAGVAHSLWSSELGDAFAVLNGTLLQLRTAGSGIAPSTIRTGMPALPVSYSRGPDGDVYWSNGSVIRRVSAGVDRPVATPPPVAVPALLATIGALPAGRYLLAFTVTTVDGESPATEVHHCTVPANGGIAFTGPTVNIYMSGPDGDILTYQGTGTGTIITHTESGRRCQTLDRDLMPAGTIVRHYNGRLLVAAGPMLYLSDPYNYGVFTPVSGYIPFPAPITVIEPTDNGVYICADKTYWSNDLMADTLQTVQPDGGIFGSSGRSPNDQTVFWQGPRGLVVADKNQGMKLVQQDALTFTDAASGASMFRQWNGMTHIVTSRAGAQPDRAAASTYMNAEFVRQGTIL